AGVRAADSLRPVFAARAAKRAGRPVAPAEMEAAQRSMARAPIEAALLRWAIWVGAAIYLALRLVRAGLLSWPSGTGLVTATIVHAGAIAAVRAIVWERTLLGARRAILPNVDPLRE